MLNCCECFIFLCSSMQTERGRNQETAIGLYISLSIISILIKKYARQQSAW